MQEINLRFLLKSRTQRDDGHFGVLKVKRKKKSDRIDGMIWKGIDQVTNERRIYQGAWSDKNFTVLVIFGVLSVPVPST